MLWFYIVLGVIALIFTGFFFVRLYWNIKLQRFQKRNKIKPSKAHVVKFRYNIIALNVFLIVSILSIIGGSYRFKDTYLDGNLFKPYVIENVDYQNAKKFSSDKEFKSVLETIYSNRDKPRPFFNMGAKDGVDLPTAELGGVDGRENISDTYNQVEGIKEADIVKIDASGRYIYYGPRYDKTLYRIERNEDGSLNDYQKLTFERFVFTELLLTDDYVIVFGNVYEQHLSSDFDYFEYSYYWFYQKSSYKIIDVETFEVVDEGYVDGNIMELRLVDDVIYILSSRHIQYEGEKPINLPSYEDIYYFNGKSNSYVITNLTSFNLKTKTSYKIGFLGDNDSFYMGQDYIILSNRKWEMTRNVSSLGSYFNRSNVVAISYTEEGKLNYVASTEVEGHIINQYFVDTYEGYIRLVTTFGKNDKNSVYILKPKLGTDQLEIIGLLYKNIGKPGESVKSVTFDKNLLKVVTFRQIDPLYTIDLSDPTKPVIIGEIEEPGYSSSLIIWDDLGNTIGLGFMADLDGRLIGFKVAAYKHDNEDEAAQTIEFSDEDYGYTYVPALYNQRQHLLINKEQNIYGFIVYSTKQKEEKDSYTVAMVFSVDFTKEEPLTKINLTDLKLSDDIEKMVLINDVIYILSPEEVILYDIDNQTLQAPLLFD